MKIIWSVSAKEDVHEIYTYYKVTASLLIAKSIKAKIFSKTSLLIKHKEMGRIEENKNVVNKGYRFLVSGNYKIVYRVIDENNILIASVFDCRQNPDKMMNK
jgi:toxin ParE1/3/4